MAKQESLVDSQGTCAAYICFTTYNSSRAVGGGGEYYSGVCYAMGMTREL